jgi:hypothetical protein
MVGLTELHRVQRGDVTAERLHREDGDLIADISGVRPTRWSARCSYKWIDRYKSFPGGKLRYLPRDNLCIMSARLFIWLPVCVCVCVYVCRVGMGWGLDARALGKKEDKEGTTPYMTGNSEDASLWDWQIG